MPDCLTKEERDRKLIEIAHSFTDLTEEDIQILLDVSHALPSIGSLESGDTYINILTREGESMVAAQYRHPDCDLYKRDIIGEIEKKEDEPAVYRALEYGIPGRGLIGIIDDRKIVVRHTVSPIFNEHKKVIGSLTYEYLNSGSDTEPIRIVNKEGKAALLDSKLDKLISNLQEGFLIYDEEGICTFANARAGELYQKTGYRKGLIGRGYDELKLTEQCSQQKIADCGTVKNEVQIGQYVFEENISTIWEDGVYQGIMVILRDKTRIRQMEEEIAYRAALIHEVHHRVKNNLQTIISLVGLEAAQKKDDEVKAFAKTLTGYIRSMSVTYDLLAHTGTESVDLKMMLEQIIDCVLESWNIHGCRVHAKISGDNLELPEHVASTVALIVNELVTNSIKYAFCGRAEGHIFLTIEKGAEYSWITVRDDGCGIDEESGEKPRKGLGLRLVDSLVKSSLKGKLIISGGGGTAVRFSIHTGAFASGASSSGAAASGTSSPGAAASGTSATGEIIS